MPYSIEAEVNQFYELRSSLKTLGWSLFDPGHPEVVGCGEGFPRYLALLMWLIYQGRKLVSRV